MTNIVAPPCPEVIFIQNLFVTLTCVRKNAFNEETQCKQKENNVFHHDKDTNTSSNGLDRDSKSDKISDVKKRESAIGSRRTIIRGC